MALVANHPVEVTMHQNALPGRQQSYFLESAKGAARTNIQTRNTSRRTPFCAYSLKAVKAGGTCSVRFLPQSSAAVRTPARLWKASS